MTYTPPKIGFDETDTKRLTDMGWPNRLMGASSGEIALAHKVHTERRLDREDTNLAVWTFWICMAVFAAMCVALYWGAGQ